MDIEKAIEAAGASGSIFVGERGVAVIDAGVIYAESPFSRFSGYRVDGRLLRLVAGERPSIRFSNSRLDVEFSAGRLTLSGLSSEEIILPSVTVQAEAGEDFSVAVAAAARVEGEEMLIRFVRSGYSVVAQAVDLLMEMRGEAKVNFPFEARVMARSARKAASLFHRERMAVGCNRRILMLRCEQRSAFLCCVAEKDAETEKHILSSAASALSAVAEARLSDLRRAVQAACAAACPLRIRANSSEVRVEVRTHGVAFNERIFASALSEAELTAPAKPMQKALDALQSAGFETAKILSKKSLIVLSCKNDQISATAIMPVVRE